MTEKYLPVGTIVLLKDANKKLMITGFGIIKPGSEKVYDYSGCSYPEGIIDSKSIFVFDHSQIADIYYLGYVNDEETKFKAFLKNIPTTQTQVG